MLRAHSADDSGYRFERTSVPLNLIATGERGELTLASRADAKRVASRLSQFSVAELDFNGISDIGHAFADELFRVYHRQHPALQLVPVGMAPRVAAMVASVA